jgi:hypothetical protein
MPDFMCECLFVCVRVHVCVCVCVCSFSYATYAWGQDHLQPISRQGKRGVCDMGLSIVDPLDTMILMDLPDEYAKSLQWILTSLKYVGACTTISFCFCG